MINENGNLQNTLFTGDNLFILHGMNSESVDLIYLDPPFNSKRTYSAPVGSKAAGSSFKDMWTWKDINDFYLEKLAEKYQPLVFYIRSIQELHSKPMMAYVTYMTQRILEMYRILKDTGSFYLHCDPTATHYLKNILDFVFGKKNFINEIVWCYSNSGRSKKKFATKHDIILCYSKTEKYYWNYSIPLSQKYLDTHYKQLDKDGKRCRIRIDFGKERIYYPEDGMTCNDWWSDIQSLNSMAMERTGYPTQKPLALLHRIIKASSKEGDVVLDPFCGCATTCVASQQLGRKWIGIDIEEKAVEVLIERLSNDAGLFEDFVARKDVPKRTDVEYIDFNTNTVKERLYREQDGLCNGCQVEFEERNLEVDHVVPKSKGGGDYFENYQLLCGSCNRIKGARPMEYLRMKIEAFRLKIKHRLQFGE